MGFAFILPGILLIYFSKKIIQDNARMYPMLYKWPSQQFWVYLVRFIGLLWIIIGINALLTPHGW